MEGLKIVRRRTRTNVWRQRPDSYAYNPQTCRLSQILPEPTCHNKIACREVLTLATGNWRFKNLRHSTQSTPNPQHRKITLRCERNAQHSHAVGRHVERLGGPARYLCRACWWQARATETRAVLVARFCRLFKGSPWIFRSGGVVRTLAAILAPIDREGRATT